MDACYRFPVTIGGAGGGTVGSGQGAVSAPSAPSGGGEIMGMQLIDAQRKLIEAQTENIQEDTANKAGFERNKGTAEARLAKNVAQFYVDTYAANYDIIQDRASILQDEAQIKRKDRMVSDETWKLEITSKEAELIGLGLANELKRAQKDLTEQQMVQVAESIRQKWEEVNIKRGHLDLDKFIKDVKDSTKLTTDVIFKIIGLIK